MYVQPDVTTCLSEYVMSWYTMEWTPRQRILQKGLAKHQPVWAQYCIAGMVIKQIPGVNSRAGLPIT